MEIARRVFTAILPVLLLLGVAPFALAANVTFSTAVTSSSVTDVSTSGTLINAYNVGFTSVPSETINGVTFQPFAVGTNQNPTTVGNYTLFESHGQPGDLVSDNALYGSAATPFANLPAAYQGLLASAAQSFGAAETLQLTMNGLTVGQQYQVQVWSNFSSNGNALEAPGTQTIQGGAGNLITMDQNTANADGGIGQYVIGTFTADAASETLNMNSPDQAPVINAFQVRAVPEPTTCAMLIPLAVAVSIRRRRAVNLLR